MSKKLKILFTIPNFETAGSGRVVYDLVKGLDKNRFEVSISCRHNRGAFFKEVEALGVPIIIRETTVAYRPYYNMIGRLHPIVQFFKKEEFDVIHSWDWSSDWTEVSAARRAGVKWLYTKKAMSWGNRHWKIRSWMAHFIITINDEMRSFFPRKKKQALIPLGIDTEYYSPKHYAEKPDDAKFQMVTVANLVPVKGIEVLLEAVALMKEPNAHLKIVGDHSGDYGELLVAQCTMLGIEHQVEFVGKVEDVRPFIAGAHVYIIPTLDAGRKEGMPMALVEAMCMATPVLGSNISGINYVLKDFQDLLFEASNVKQLSEKLNTMHGMSTFDRDVLGVELREYCEDNYGMQQFISAHEQLYIQLAQE